MPEGSYARLADHPPHSASSYFELAFSVYGSVFMALHNFSFHPGLHHANENTKVSLHLIDKICLVIFIIVFFSFAYFRLHALCLSQSKTWWENGEKIGKNEETEPIKKIMYMDMIIILALIPCLIPVPFWS